MIQNTKRGPSVLLAIAILALTGLAEASIAAPEAAAQRRRAEPLPPTLRAKPHKSFYRGTFEVVGRVGGEEQYRVGPETIQLGVDVSVDADGNMFSEYTLDFGADDPSVGTTPYSVLGLVADQWRPTLEGLPFISFLPLPEEPKAVGGEWARLSAYTLSDLELDFAEATRFSIESIEGDVITILYSAEGGGTTTIEQPQFGRDAKREITRESAREGTFVFHLTEGRVVSSERLERIVTTSVLYVSGQDPQPGPEESQTLTFQLLPADGSR